MEVVTASVEDTLVAGRERFLGFVRSKVANPELAEDILQDALLKALRAAPTLKNRDALIGWFYRILNNAIIDAYRARGSAPPETELIEAGEIEAQPEEHAALCECFRAVLPGLNTGYAELIERLDLGESSPESEARRLGITAGALKVRRHRARQALRRQLEATCRVCAEHHCLDCTCKG